MIVSLGEAADESEFDSLFATPEHQLLDRLKLVVNPADVKIPWASTGPKNSPSVLQLKNQECHGRRFFKIHDSIIFTQTRVSRTLDCGRLPTRMH
jgi:hypothetical protein